MTKLSYKHTKQNRNHIHIPKEIELYSKINSTVEIYFLHHLPVDNMHMTRDYEQKEV